MRLLFYPEPLRKTSKLYRIISKRDDVSFHNDPRSPHDFHIFWSYTPKSITPDDTTKRAPDVINRGCWDISKQKVNGVFNDISVDPHTFEGVCVEKRDAQGAHNHHRIVTCPKERIPGFVYQKYIESKEGNEYVSYRVHYAGGIQMVVKKKKPNMFRSGYTSWEIVPKEDYFSQEQERWLVRCCDEFGLDYGEVDFLMGDGGPVVIDVNNVVGGSADVDALSPKITARGEQIFWDYLKRRSTPIIVIPAYKAYGFIRDCLDAATKEGDVLLGIDGCKETLHVVKKIYKKYPNLRVFWYPENKGTYVTLNSLISHVPQDRSFIVFGADDVMNKGIGHWMMRSRPCISRYSGVVCMTKRMYDEFGGFKPWRVAADSDMLTRIHKKYPIKRLPILYKHRVHAGQMTRGKYGKGSEYRNKLAKQIKSDINKGILYVKPVTNKGIEI